MFKIIQFNKIEMLKFCFMIIPYNSLLEIAVIFVFREYIYMIGGDTPEEKSG